VTSVSEDAVRSSFFWVFLVIVGMIYAVGFGIILILLGISRSNVFFAAAGVLAVAAGILGVVFRKQIVQGCGDRFERYFANTQQWLQARREQSEKWYLWDGLETVLALLIGMVFIAPLFLGRWALALIGMFGWFAGLSVLAGVRAYVTQLAWKGSFSGTFQIIRG
jgi:hypothetical protein